MKKVLTIIFLGCLIGGLLCFIITDTMNIAKQKRECAAACFPAAFEYIDRSGNCACNEKIKMVRPK